MNSSMVNHNTCQECELVRNLELLREIPYFSGLSMECLKLLAYLCIRETYAPGDMLFERDNDDARAHYLVSGKLEILRHNSDGPVVCRTLGPGSFLGAVALLGNLRRLFSARAVEETVCRVLAREKFANAMHRFPDQMPRYLQAVVNAIRTWEARQCAEEVTCEVCLDKMGVTLL